MAFADLKSLFESDNFRLPYLETEDRKSFLHHYHERMDHFINELKTVPQSAIDSADKNNLITNVGYIIQELEEILRLYLDGLPAQAYSRFKALAEFRTLASRLVNWRTISLDSKTPFYRTKKEFNYKKKWWERSQNGFLNYVKSIDMFHVPFEKRKIIGTNRFSIPGFPCIYLSGTLHTSWSEAVENKAQHFHAVSYRNHRPLYVVDVVPINFAKPVTAGNDYLAKLYNYNDYNDVFIDYVILFPLITACHSKISYTSSYAGEVKFKSEYIIPQLLLQWYRDNHIVVDGIRYLSCTAEARFPKELFDKYNYVMPAIQMMEEGYCSHLLHNYSATPVYSYLRKSKESEFEMLQGITRELNKASFKTLI